MPEQSCGHGRGPYTFKPPYCMYHGSDTNHCTKYCSKFIESKTKMEQDSNQPLHQSSSREVNHTMHWPAPHTQYFPSHTSLFPPQTYQTQRSSSSGLLSVLSLCDNQPSSAFANYTNSIPSASITNYLSNVKQCQPTKQARN
jgi:hypothetical protein